jgi:hypothetical protein
MDDDDNAALIDKGWRLTQRGVQDGLGQVNDV